MAISPEMIVILMLIAFIGGLVMGISLTKPNLMR